MEYQGWINPYAANIGDQIARSADAQARAAEIIGQAQARAAELSGSAWSGAVRSVGQIPTQLEAMRDAEVTRKLKEQELAATVEQRADATRTRVAMAVGRLAAISDTPDKFSAGVNELFRQGVLDRATAGHILANVAAAGADGFGDLRRQHIQFAEQFQPGIKLGEGDVFSRPSLVPGQPATILARGGKKPLDVAPGHVVMDEPQAGGAAPTPLVPVGSAPFAPGTGQQVINGQVVDAQGARIGAPVPPQEKPSDVAVANARVDEINKSIEKLDNEIAGTMPVSETDRLRLGLERQKLQNELEHYKALERKEDPLSPANQERLEQQYRGVATKVLSSRSGGLGLQDAKVDQALHLLQSFEQNKDPKTGEYHIPLVVQRELATGLAQLMSPGNVVAQGQINEIDQRTARSDLAGLMTYLTGSPVTGNTQAIFKMLRDSIERQGKVAESEREHYLDSIRAYAPTDLSEARRTAIEKGLRLSRMSDVGGTDASGHKVGDPVTYQGKTYRIKAIENGKAVLEPTP